MGDDQKYTKKELDAIKYNNKVNKAVKQLSGLTYNKKKYTEEELKAKAHRLVTLKNNLAEIQIETLFEDAEDRRYSKKLASQYLTDYSIETISDINNLRQIVYLEIINIKLQKKLNENKDSVPTNVLDSIHKNLREIINLKEQLGISKHKEQEQQEDALGYFQTLKRKYKVWLEENQATRTTMCPHCSEYILLKIKTDIYDAQKHFMFKDRILGNSHLIKLYEDKKLTKEDLALIFESSPDYIEWLCEKWNKKKVANGTKSES